MKKLIQIITNTVLFFFSLISLILTRRGRVRFGKLIGMIIKLIMPRREAIALDNLIHAFPEKSLSEINSIIKKSFDNLGIVLAEIIAFVKMPDERILDYLYIENKEVFDDVQSRGKGCILISGHYGNWELLAYASAIVTGINFLIVVESQRNSFIDKKMNEFRTRRGNRVVSRYAAAREIVKQLRDNGIVAFLVDQSATKDKDIFIDFFGRPAATYDAPASLSLRFKVPVLFAYGVRQPDGRYGVKVTEIPTSDLENNQEGIEELTRRHVKLLENAIREHPELWVWEHRRWKHSPNKIG